MWTRLIGVRRYQFCEFVGCHGQSAWLYHANQAWTGVYYCEMHSKIVKDALGNCGEKSPECTSDGRTFREILEDTNVRF